MKDMKSYKAWGYVGDNSMKPEEAINRLARDNYSGFSFPNTASDRRLERSMERSPIGKRPMR